MYSIQWKYIFICVQYILAGGTRSWSSIANVIDAIGWTDRQTDRPGILRFRKADNGRGINFMVGVAASSG